MSWTALLRSQAAAACDLVTVDTALGRRFYLLFFIDVPTRRVTLAGITTNPTGAWTAQAARNLFITAAYTFEGCKMLVRDRAGEFTDTFDEIFRSEGIKTARTPPRTPVANCYTVWVPNCSAVELRPRFGENRRVFRLCYRLLAGLAVLAVRCGRSKEI